MGKEYLDVADLQNMALLEQRKKLGKGELSSIAFAMKTGLAFLTDDQKARKLAEGVLDKRLVQTTPHLFGWLFFRAYLLDTDKALIIKEHEAAAGTLTPYFDSMYNESLRCRALSRMQVAGDESA
jgi:hypothetical protein